MQRAKSLSPHHLRLEDGLGYLTDSPKEKEKWRLWFCPGSRKNYTKNRGGRRMPSRRPKLRMSGSHWKVPKTASKGIFRDI